MKDQDNTNDCKAEHADVQKLQALKGDAIKAATARGHVLKRFGPTHMHHGGYQAVANCKHCLCHVQVITRPQPNEIDMGGDALAVGCAGTRIPKGKTDTYIPADAEAAKHNGLLLRKEVLDEREYLEELQHCIAHLLSAARNGDPYRMNDAAGYVKGSLETYPMSKIIRVDLHM